MEGAGRTTIIAVRQNRRFTKNIIRKIEVKDSDIVDGKIRYCGKLFTIHYYSNRRTPKRLRHLLPSIFLNEHKGAFHQCETCKKPDGINPKVPWGKTECISCREITGQCYRCKANRNDCSC